MFQKFRLSTAKYDELICEILFQETVTIETEADYYIKIHKQIEAGVEF